MRTAIIFFDKSGAVYSVASIIGDDPAALVRAHWDDNTASAFAFWGTAPEKCNVYDAKP